MQASTFNSVSSTPYCFNNGNVTPRIASTVRSLSSFVMPVKTSFVVAFANGKSGIMPSINHPANYYINTHTETIPIARSLPQSCCNPLPPTMIPGLYRKVVPAISEMHRIILKVSACNVDFDRRTIADLIDQ